jgi:hypothetical protein
VAVLRGGAVETDITAVDATPTHILRELLDSSPNPFSDAVLPNAFRDTPDVTSIHQPVRTLILDQVQSVRDSGNTSLQVITGDAGEGKTHLLAWLRRTSEESWRRGDGRAFALAPIAPLRTLDRPMHHVLQEMVWRLAAVLPQTSHTDAETDSPFELVLWRGLLSVIHRVQPLLGAGEPGVDRLRELLALRPERYLATFVDQIAEIWPELEEVFVQRALRLPELAEVDREVFRILARFPRPQLRSEILDWLGGASLPPERLARLEAGFTLEGEGEAARALRTLLLVASLARLPIVLAFDQIEAIARLGDEGITELLETLSDLYNEGRGAAVLVFCQTHLWPKLRDTAQLPVRDRLEASPVVNLKALTPEEGLAIVEKRLAHFWQGHGATPPSAQYPFDAEQVLQLIRRENLRTPRKLLIYFRSLVRDPAGAPPPEPPPPAPGELVRRKLASLRDEEGRSPVRSPEARAAITQGMLQELFLHARRSGRPLGTATVVDAGEMRVNKTRNAGTRVVLRQGDQKKSIYLEVSNSINGVSAAATAKRLAEGLRLRMADRVFFVREAAYPLPAAANALMAEITPRGAIIWLRDTDVAPLAALEALLNAAAGRDIDVDKETALHAAVSILGPELVVAERVAGAALEEPGAVGKAAAPAAAPESPRPADDGDAESRVHGFLRSRRAMFPVPALAEQLGLPVARVHQAIETLRDKGVVELVDDRRRVPVAILRPGK